LHRSQTFFQLCQGLVVGIAIRPGVTLSIAADLKRDLPGISDNIEKGPGSLRLSALNIPDHDPDDVRID